MLEHRTDEYGTFRFVSLLFIGAITILLAVAFTELGYIARVGIFLSSILVCISGVIIIYRVAQKCGGDTNMERMAVVIIIVGLGGPTILIHLEHLLDSQVRRGDTLIDRWPSEHMPVPRPPMMSQKQRNNDLAAGKGAPSKPSIDPLSKKEMMPMETIPSKKESLEPKIPREIADEINRLLKESDRLFKESREGAAAELLVKAIDIVDNKLPRNLPTRGKIAATLAKIKFGSGEVEAALTVVDAHLAKLVNFSDKTSAAEFHSLAGTLLGNAKKFKDAVARFEKALSIYEKHGAKPMDIAPIKAKLAISYARMGRKEEATSAFEEAKKRLEAAGPDAGDYLEKLTSVAKEYDVVLQP